MFYFQMYTLFPMQVSSCVKRPANRDGRCTYRGVMTIFETLRFSSLETMKAILLTDHYGENICLPVGLNRDNEHTSFRLRFD